MKHIKEEIGINLRSFDDVQREMRKFQDRYPRGRNFRFDVLTLDEEDGAKIYMVCVDG